METKDLKSREERVGYLEKVYGGIFSKFDNKVIDGMLADMHDTNLTAFAAKDGQHADLRLELQQNEQLSSAGLAAIEAMCRADAWNIMRWLHANLPTGTVNELRGMITADIEWNSQ